MGSITSSLPSDGDELFGDNGSMQWFVQPLSAAWIILPADFTSILILSLLELNSICPLLLEL